MVNRNTALESRDLHRQLSLWRLDVSEAAPSSKKRFEVENCFYSPHFTSYVAVDELTFYKDLQILEKKENNQPVDLYKFNVIYKGINFNKYFIKKKYVQNLPKTFLKYVQIMYV